MNKIIKTFLVFLPIIALLFFLYASCTKKEINIFVKHNDILALVDGYKITLEDYLSQKAKYTPFYNDNAPVDKNAIMENLINDIVLLKEAENLKLNQDKTFLKEIEYFWRQSLIESLLKKKTAEIRNQIRISEEETQKVYNAFKKEYFARIIQLSVDKAALKTEPSKVDEAFLKAHPDYIQYDSGFNWTDLKSLDPQLRHALLAMEIPLNKWFFIEDKKVSYLLFLEKNR